MASSKLLLEKVSDVTECPICTETMVEPKLLPCIHSFCLKCLNQFWKDKQPGDRVPCPLCRADFLIPSGGLAELRTNFFIEKLTDAQKLSDQVAILSQNSKCDICMCREIEKDASDYCVDCRQNLCEECTKVHQLLSNSRCHKVQQVLSTEKCSKMEELLIKSEAFCTKHNEKKIEIFCLECKSALCTSCFILAHNGHDCADINDVIDDVRVQIKEDIEITNDIVFVIDRESRNVENLEKDFNASIQKAIKEISENGEMMKRIIDRHIKDLLYQLKVEKSLKLNELETMKKRLLNQKLNCESFQKYAEEVLNKADSTDVARFASDLNKMATDLKNVNLVHISKPIEVSYVPPDFVTSSENGDVRHLAGNKIIGTIQMQNIVCGPICWNALLYENLPKVANTIEFSKEVRGILALGDEIFFTLYKTSAIKVYCSETFSKKSSIPVDGLDSPWDMAGAENIIYVGDNKGRIFRVDLTTRLSTYWSVPGTGLTSLSTNKDGKLLVACKGSNKLYEYTPSGTLMREIALPRGVTKPQRAVHLKSDRFLVCQVDDYLHRVCLIDDQGQILRSHGNYLGSKQNQLNQPYRVVVDRYGYILVADFKNGRVVVLNDKMEVVKELMTRNTFRQTYNIREVFLHGRKLLFSIHLGTSDRVDVYNLQ